MPRITTSIVAFDAALGDAFVARTNMLGIQEESLSMWGAKRYSLVEFVVVVDSYWTEWAKTRLQQAEDAQVVREIRATCRGQRIQEKNWRAGKVLLRLVTILNQPLA